MASSSDSLPSEQVDWQQWLAANDLPDPALDTNDRAQPPGDSTTTDALQAESAHNSESAGRSFHSDLSVLQQNIDAVGTGDNQYRQPLAAQRWQDVAGIENVGQNDSFNTWNTAGTSQRAAHGLPVSAFAQQQPSGKTVAYPSPSWMGNDVSLERNTHVANLNPVPRLNHSGASSYQPYQTWQAQQSALSGHNAMAPNLTPLYSQPTAHNMATGQVHGRQAPFPNFRQFDDMQRAGSSGTLRASQTSISHGSRVNPQLFFGTNSTTSVPIQPPSGYTSTIPHTGTGSPASAAETTRTVGPNPAPSTPRQSSTREGTGRSRGGEVADFVNYPPPSQPLPAGISREQICRNYPNHLHGDTLLRVVHGEGEEGERWGGKKIWDNCPIDGRRNAKTRPHNYLEARILRTQSEASGGGQAVRGSGRRNRSRDAIVSEEDDADEQRGLSLKRPRLAEGQHLSSQYRAQSALPGLVPHIGASQWRLQARHDASNGSVTAGARRAEFVAADEKTNIGHGEAGGISSFSPDKPSQRVAAPPQDDLSSAVVRPGASAPPAPESDNTIIGKRLQSVALANFQSDFQHEVEYQHRLISSLHPQWDGMAREDRLALVQAAWKDQYRTWERIVRRVVGIPADTSGQGKVTIFALLQEISKHELQKTISAESTARNEAELELLRLDVLTSVLRGCCKAIKQFRDGFMKKFTAQDGQTMAVPGSATDPLVQSSVATGGRAGASNSTATRNPGAQTVETPDPPIMESISTGQEDSEHSIARHPGVEAALSGYAAQSDKVDSVGSRLSQPIEEASAPRKQTGPAGVTEQFRQLGNSAEADLQPLELIGHDGLEDLFEEHGGEPAVPSGISPGRSEDSIGQIDGADLEDITRFEKELAGQDDDNEELAQGNQTIFSNGGARLSLQSADGHSLARSASPVASESSKGSRTTRARRAPSSRSTAAAPARTSPTVAEIQAEAARRAELDEVAFRRAEELGADRAWIATQTILGTDGTRYPVSPHDVISWHGAYRASDQPLTANDAKAAVVWMQHGCPGVTKFTENAKERKQRDNREKAEERKRFRTEHAGRGDD